MTRAQKHRPTVTPITKQNVRHVSTDVLLAAVEDCMDAGFGLQSERSAYTAMEFNAAIKRLNAHMGLLNRELARRDHLA